jgi:hypothetical protein
VGWAGLSPVAGLIEYVLGLRADAPNGRLLWDVRLLEEHGVLRYPFGREGVLDLAAQRADRPGRSLGWRCALRFRWSW